MYSSKDSSSFSNPNEAISTNIHIDWTLDFDNKIIKENAEYTIHPPHPVLGNKVSIQVPQSHNKVGSTFDVIFHYSIDESASAVQWLDPKATNGGVYPYIFTQSQAIHARSLLPCMDTPGVKTPYTAVVRAPVWCTVLMSALAEKSSASPLKKRSTSKTDSDSVNRFIDPPGVFRWSQPVAVSAYLIALAAGHLSSIDISPRVRVWSEPEIVQEAATEFSQTEDFLTTAESLTCPYQWTRYDILLLPSSFPYGGMENPCLTFATPTLLAGDKSLANVIAHEIAHSWTGNLVTNFTWEHFWLNEGWTVWLERNIMGKYTNDINVLKLSAQGGWKHYIDDVDRMGKENPFTRLVWPLGEEDPDDAFSSVPYEKGFNFLYYLENLVGTPNFHLFVKAYIERYKFSTITSGEFKDFFIQYFTSLAANQSLTNSSSYKYDELVNKLATIDWDTWLLSTGLPPVTPDFSNDLSKQADDLSNKWIEADATGEIASAIATANTIGWTSEQNDADWIVNDVVEFLGSQGRMKFVRPLYRLLRSSDVGSKVAVETFDNFSERYHPIARKMIANDLSNVQKQEDENEALVNSKTNYVVEEAKEFSIPTMSVVNDDKIDKKVDIGVDIKNIKKEFEEVISKNESKKDDKKYNNKKYGPYINTTSVLVITGIAIATIGIFAYLKYKK
eukprot:gene21569-27927_t